MQASIVEGVFLDLDSLAIGGDAARGAHEPDVDDGVAAHFLGFLDQVLDGLVGTEHRGLDNQSHALGNLVVDDLGERSEDFSFNNVLCHNDLIFMVFGDVGGHCM